ncbi:hypothetical protein lerEdw1_001301 [Lerista edwardsae]|nr:hypothetical protein lerEdw1_001301 [Lerista edwardsae]
MEGLESRAVELSNSVAGGTDGLASPCGQLADLKEQLPLEFRRESVPHTESAWPLRQLPFIPVILLDTLCASL